MDGLMMNYQLTLAAIMQRAESLHGPREIVTRQPDRQLHRYTYADFIKRAKRLALALQRLGVQPGERVATLAWNHYQHLEAYFAIPISGAVIHTLNIRLSGDDLGYIANHAGDSVVLVDQVLWPIFARFREQVPFRHVIVIGQNGTPLPAGTLDYEQLIAAEDESAFSYREIDENQAAAMCYTSGTTGRPKGVVYSHRALVLEALVASLSDTSAINQKDTLLPVVPMFHINAWGMPFLSTMLGSKLIFPGPYLDAASLLDLFEREQVTVTAGVPTIWLAILNELDKDPQRWKLVPGMRMLVGGSAAPEAILRGFDRHNLQVIHAWGMTETTALGTFGRLMSGMEELPIDEQYSLRALQGRPVPFLELRVRGEQGILPWDGKSLGELEVRAPWVARTYYNSPEGADRFTADGWFKTGDVGTVDELGYMKIQDRSKDVIKSAGEWISSVDLENALMGHPAVAEAAVIAIPDPRWQERPLAVVVLKEGQSATAQELLDYLRPRFVKWWLPDDVVFVASIPRTTTGKFLKMSLREQFSSYVPERRA